jgi:hypothetical protein
MAVEGTITMSAKERGRLRVIEAVCERRVRQGWGGRTTWAVGAPGEAASLGGHECLKITYLHSCTRRCEQLMLLQGEAQRLVIRDVSGCVAGRLPYNFRYGLVEGHWI